MKKLCRVCKKKKPIDEYHYKIKNKDIRHSWCKSCQKEYRDNYYQMKRDVYIKNATNRKRKVSQEYRLRIIDYLQNHPCVDCGETDPIVLEFDHVRGKKLFSVGSHAASGGSWEKILSEIEKCDVRCCNCHRRKTAHERGWHQGLVA